MTGRGPHWTVEPFKKKKKKKKKKKMEIMFQWVLGKWRTV
jgi:hypothetical protein